MTPHEMLAVLDDALAHHPSRRGIAVELTVPAIRFTDPPSVFVGKPIPYPDGTRTYGYTSGQCQRMRAVILAAANEDTRSGDG